MRFSAEETRRCIDLLKSNDSEDIRKAGWVLEAYVLGYHSSQSNLDKYKTIVERVQRLIESGGIASPDWV